MSRFDPGHKAVYVNGILVGHVAATGEQQRDIEAIREFMRARGLGSPDNPFRAIQGQAGAFAAAAKAVYERYLRTTPAGNGLMAVPFVVNSAFSIELYLKTLHEVHGTPQRGHHLLALYDALPPDTRASIERAAVTCAPRYFPPREAVRPFVFRDFMSAPDNSFVKWRYAHEAGSTGMVQIQPTILVMVALHEVSQDMLAEHVRDAARRADAGSPK